MSFVVQADDAAYYVQYSVHRRHAGPQVLHDRLCPGHFGVPRRYLSRQQSRRGRAWWITSSLRGRK